jgi:predicted DNA-binding transcriptional regulator AlpA
MQENILRTTAEAAKYLALASSTLEKFRIRGAGPKFVRLGSRAIRYRIEDLDLWLARCERRSTSDRGGEAA